MPTEVRRAVGYALFAAQQGEKHDDAKVLKGFGDAAVLEVIARHDGDTFLPSTRSASVNGNSVFVDDKLEPLPDQCYILNSLAAWQ